MTEWIVKWEDGKTQKYVPYDSYGMTSFIKQGLKKGKVTVNDKEVYITEEGYWMEIQNESVMKPQVNDYEQECDAYWDSLSKEDQLKAFYSVCKRIHKGDVEELGSYRYVLYDVFGFESNAYRTGMDCGYFSIHNLIFEALHTQETKGKTDENRQT